MDFYEDKVDLEITKRDEVKEEHIQEVTVITWYKMKNFADLRFRVKFTFASR